MGWIFLNNNSKSQHKQKHVSNNRHFIISAVDAEQSFPLSYTYMNSSSTGRSFLLAMSAPLHEVWKIFPLFNIRSFIKSESIFGMPSGAEIRLSFMCCFFFIFIIFLTSLMMFPCGFKYTSNNCLCWAIWFLLAWTYEKHCWNLSLILHSQALPLSLSF